MGSTLSGMSRAWAVVDDEPELNLHREYFCRTESGEHFCVDQCQPSSEVSCETDWDHL